MLDTDEDRRRIVEPGRNLDAGRVCLDRAHAGGLHGPVRDSQCGSVAATSLRPEYIKANPTEQCDKSDDENGDDDARARLPQNQTWTLATKRASTVLSPLTVQIRGLSEFPLVDDA
jgi:hypothetical protein